MSEYVSYTTTAINDEAAHDLQRELARNGIFFHDQQAWSTAADRVEELQRRWAGQLETARDQAEKGDARGTSEFRELAAMAHAFESMEPFRAVAEALCPEPLKKVRYDLAKYQASDAGRLNRADIAQSRNLLEQMATDIHRYLCETEKRLLIRKITDALGEMNYRIDRRQDLLRATKAQTCIWAEINPHGEISMDISGVSGLSCMAVMQSVESALKKKGIRLQRRVSEYHGRPEGGSLVKDVSPAFRGFQAIRHRQPMNTRDSGKSILKQNR